MFDPDEPTGLTDQSLAGSGTSIAAASSADVESVFSLHVEGRLDANTHRT